MTDNNTDETFGGIFYTEEYFPSLDDDTVEGTNWETVPASKTQAPDIPSLNTAYTPSGLYVDDTGQVHDFVDLKDVSVEIDSIRVQLYDIDKKIRYVDRMLLSAQDIYQKAYDRIMANSKKIPVERAKAIARIRTEKLHDTVIGYTQAVKDLTSVRWTLLNSLKTLEIISTNIRKEIGTN